MVALNSVVTQDASAELAPRPLISSSLHDATFGNVEDLAGLLLQVLCEGNGGTFHMGTHVPPSTGYCVAVPMCEMVLAEIPTINVIEAWLDHVVRPHAGSLIQYVGVWCDSDTGKVYFDAVVVEHDAERAEEFGRRWKQLAIFDLAAKEEIRL